jgi:hypothetical protein
MILLFLCSVARLISGKPCKRLAVCHAAEAGSREVAVAFSLSENTHYISVEEEQTIDWQQITQFGGLTKIEMWQCIEPATIHQRNNSTSPRDSEIRAEADIAAVATLLKNGGRVWPRAVFTNRWYVYPRGYAVGSEGVHWGTLKIELFIFIMFLASLLYL